MTPLWSGRFDTAPDAAAFEFGASFQFDRRLFEDDVTGSVAWARALATAGVLSRDEARQIEQVLTEILERGRSDPSFVDGSDEDVHSFVERLVVERLGDIGRRLHTGRSRNEQVSVDLRLYLMRRIPPLQRDIARVAAALAAQASLSGDALMPAFTHFRPAQPVLVAHFFLAHVIALLTRMKRLPSGYNKDLQEDKQGVFDAEDTLAGCVAVVRSVVGSLTLNRDRAESAASGLLLATDVADYLVGRGVPFRRAHEIVGALVRQLAAEKRDFASLSLDDWRAASDRFEADIVARMTPRVSVAAKRTPQSTAPAAVDGRLREIRVWLTAVLR